MILIKTPVRAVIAPHRKKTMGKTNILMEYDQIPLTQHCIECNADFEVKRIIKEQGSTTYHLSCGHQAKIKVINEGIKVKSRVILKRKNRDKNNNYYESEFRIKLSGKTKRLVRDSFTVDRERQIIVHHVEEQNKCGEWKVVKSQERPFAVKKDDRASLKKDA
jgi:hypothetical protein